MTARERRLLRRCARLIACARAMRVELDVELDALLDTQYAGNIQALQQFHGALRELVADLTPEQPDDGLERRAFAVPPALDRMDAALRDRSAEDYWHAYRDWRFALVSTSTVHALRCWSAGLAAVQGYAK